MVINLSARKRRTGRIKNQERSPMEAEVPETGPEQKMHEQEVEGPVEVQDNKDTEQQTEAELKSSRSEVSAPPQYEPAGSSSEHAEVEPPKAESAKPEAGQKSGGKRMAENREGVYEGFAKMNESVFSLDGVKKAAAWYIETSEKVAHQALDLQERATGWAKDTPFAPLFEAQHSIARRFVERSASAARTLWQIPPTQ